MQIIELNCMTFKPLGIAELAAKLRLPKILFDLVQEKAQDFVVPTRSLLLVLNQGKELILIDAGFSRKDLENMKNGKGFAQQFLSILGRPIFEESASTLEQIIALGFDPENVKHIILSHLDIDHMSGISDFPQAKIHLSFDELQAATNPKNPMELLRYRHLKDYAQSNWISYEYQGKFWMGLEAMDNLEGLPANIYLVPLYGHTRGHVGIAIDHEDSKTLFIADACMDLRDLDVNNKSKNLFSQFYNKVMHVDKAGYLLSKRKLQNLLKFHSSKIKLISAHHPIGEQL